ncbi:hypothetical protein [Vibrio sp. M260112]|uniref:hypothetical protein n=1 Tax=Vibrio sp. M260112 TaxID=3020895 RepID=UPI002F405361
MRKFDSFSLIVVIVCSLFFFILGVGLTAFTALESVVGDVATWVAAVGTVLTLGFAIRQNRILREEQKQERLDREEHEHRQQEMWCQQQEMLIFEKFQRHKAAFHSVLELQESNLQIKFFDKEALYESLFPRNSFENCTTDHADTEFLNAIVERYHGIWEHIKEINSCKDGKYDEQLLVDFFIKVAGLTRTLKIQFQETQSVGNIYWNHGTPQLMCNIFTPSEFVLVLEVVIKRISSFCYVPMPIVSTEPLQARSLIPFYKFMLSPNGKNRFRTDFDEHKAVLSILLRAHQEFDRPGWNHNGDEKKMVEVYIRISNLISDAHKLIELFSSKEEINKLVVQLTYAISDYMVTAPRPNANFVQIHSDLLDLRRK